MEKSKNSINDIYTSRLREVKAQLENRELDSLLVTNSSNIFYLSGLEVNNCLLLIEAGEQYLFTDYRFKQEVEEVRGLYKIVVVKNKILDNIGERCRKDKIKKLAVEGKYISVKSFKKIRDILSSVEIITDCNIIEELRVLKDSKEIERIKKSIHILSQLYNKVNFFIKKVKTEWDLANELEYYLKKEFRSIFSFSPIVAIEEMSCFPHATPKNRVIKDSKYLMLDVGVKHKGYCSDLTRINVLSKMTPSQIKVYELLREHQRELIDLIEPGFELSKIDNFSREKLSEKGYSKNILHSVGHGIGIEVHELPRVSFNSENVAKPGMVFTIEPGLYFPNKWGMRVEDMVLVTEDGCEVLTKGIPK